MWKTTGRFKDVMRPKRIEMPSLVKTHRILIHVIYSLVTCILVVIVLEKLVLDAGGIQVYYYYYYFIGDIKYVYRLIST